MRPDLKVLISYSTKLDQILALRLQTMGAVQGLTVYVPPATSRNGTLAGLSREIQSHLDDSDVILAVMMHIPEPSAIEEMKLALATNKLLIPIVSSTVPSAYYS